MNPSGNSPRQRRQRVALERARAAAGVMLSPHAQHRAIELGFHETEVLECVRRPEQTYSAPPSHGPGRRVFQRADCACVVDMERSVVVTVLLRHPGEWIHGQDTRRSA